HARSRYRCLRCDSVAERGQPAQRIGTTERMDTGAQREHEGLDRGDGGAVAHVCDADLGPRALQRNVGLEQLQQRVLLWAATAAHATGSRRRNAGMSGITSESADGASSPWQSHLSLCWYRENRSA